MKKYRSKPTEVEAVLWVGDIQPIREFMPTFLFNHKADGLFILAGVDGAQGWVPVPFGHWIVRQPDNDLDYWPVAAEYFDSKYEEAK